MKLTITKWFALMTVLSLLSFSAYGQDAEIKGKIIDSETQEPLVAASVAIVGTTMGAATNTDGDYVIRNVPPGVYRLRASFVGYAPQEKTVNVGTDGTTADFEMKSTSIEYTEVIVEVNRARERETPVAFTTADKEEIEQRMHGQDAPLLLKGAPGLYSFSSDGTGNGEARLFVRGFNQNYVQVMINGIPTNDPESNSVYWSNWGSVSSAAASIQLQRGAGSSLYGAGAFGGAFNIVTGNARPRSLYGVNLSLGDPTNTMYGVDLNTGLINDAFAVSVRLDRKIAEGNRRGSRYEGFNYYFSGSWYMDQQQSLKLILHGAPQKHGYSFSNDISYFKYFDYKANSAPWLPRSVVDQLPANANDGKANYGLTDGRRELVTSDLVALAHNHFHKPQLELHYSYDIDAVSSLRATAFYSRGRGGGSSLNSGGFIPNSARGPNGEIADLASATTYLANAYQRDSYSLHQQGGILANYETRLNDALKITAGGEFRSWTADHPGHYVNLYGKPWISTSAQQYGVQDSTGTPTGTFRRRVYQGDLAQESDTDIFGWELATDDPTYRTQYRNYRGETPQFTLFANAIWEVIPALNITATLQYQWYQYKLTENMPSENAIGRRLTFAEKASRGLAQDANKEGPAGNGKFYMAEYVGATNTILNWYEFDLVNATRSRGFVQPKFGFNYNATENINVFGNFAHVERFVDLSIYYNSGRVNPAAEDEKSNQFEAGIGWTSRDINAKLNGYTMTWDNKSARIQDVSKAGLPGYDRNGFRSILVGASSNRGLEFEFTTRLAALTSMLNGFGLRGSLTVSQNKWEEVLESVKTDPSNGARQVFNASGRNAAGAIDTVFMDELAGTRVGGSPQTMASLGLVYQWEGFFAGIDMNYYADHYGLDGDTYSRVDGEWDATKTTFTYVYDQKLPDRTIFDAQAGYRFETPFGIKAAVSAQVLNLFDKKYLADIDNFGVQPGYLRSFRVNVNLGF